MQHVCSDILSPRIIGVEESAWGDDEDSSEHDYYNSIPGKEPPVGGLVDSRLRPGAALLGHVHTQPCRGNRTPQVSETQRGACKSAGRFYSGLKCVCVALRCSSARLSEERGARTRDPPATRRTGRRTVRAAPVRTAAWSSAAPQARRALHSVGVLRTGNVTSLPPELCAHVRRRQGWLIGSFQF